MDEIEKKAREFLEEQTAYPLNMLASVPVDAALRAIAAALTARDAELREAYSQGWHASADWSQRQDLHADDGSPAYVAERERRLALIGKEW